MKKPRKVKLKTVKAWGILLGKRRPRANKMWICPEVFHDKKATQELCWDGDEVKRVTISWRVK